MLSVLPVRLILISVPTTVKYTTSEYIVMTTQRIQYGDWVVVTTTMMAVDTSLYSSQ